MVRLVGYISPPLAAANVGDVLMAQSETVGEFSLRAFGSANGSYEIVRNLDMDAAAAVLLRCYGLEVIGIDTGANAAKVVDLVPVGDRADLLFVHSAVGEPRSASQLDAAISALRALRRSQPDPARRGKAVVFFLPEIGGNRFAPLEKANVPTNEPQWFPGNMPKFDARSGCERSRLATSALAYARGVRWLKAMSRTLRPVAANVRLRISLLLVLTGLAINSRVLSAAASTKHGADLSKGTP